MPMLESLTHLKFSAKLLLLSKYFNFQPVDSGLIIHTYVIGGIANSSSGI